MKRFHERVPNEAHVEYNRDLAMSYAQDSESQSVVLILGAALWPSAFEFSTL